MQPPSDSFHQVPVADDPVSVMVDDFKARTIVPGSQISFCHRHSDTVAESLAQGTAGHFNAGNQASFRMAGVKLSHWRNRWICSRERSYPVR